MLATVLFGPRDVRVIDDLPTPTIEDPRDAVVRVTCAAICGTDLHPYRGEILGFRPASVMGHEVVGIVEAIGAEVVGLGVGDRVVVSDVVACGRCWFCRRGWHYQCPQVSLLGYGEVVGRYLPGGQAERVRVPFADVTLLPIPDGVADDVAIFVGDVLATGYACAEAATIASGDVVAIVGCGPVGLCALQSAMAFGAVCVAIDPDPRRRTAALAIGASAATAIEDAGGVIRALTTGRGADAVLEAVGTEAALSLGLSLVRACGTVVAVGAHHATAMPFSTRDAFARELTLKFAVGDPIRIYRRLFEFIGTGRLAPARVVSHRLPLECAAEGYQLFDRHEATKVVLVPGR